MKGREHLASYDVLKEPWIPVERVDGSLVELGLLDVLKQAHTLKQIICESPLETYAVSRLLIAFLMDALTPERSNDRKKLLHAGKFPPEQLDRYIKKCVQEGCSFDLFDNKRPFMQAAFVAEFDSGKEKPVAILVHTLPTGNNHMHFDHRFPRDQLLSCEQTLRALCSTYVFCTAGLSGPSSVNNTPCTYVLCVGETLHETLTLGMLSIAECGNIPWSNPPIAWRNFEEFIPKETHAKMSILSAFTWMPRRVTLIPSKAIGKIETVYYQAGANFLGNGVWKDPHVSYRKSKKEEWFPVKPQNGRAMWRDLGSVTATSHTDPSHIPPRIITQTTVLLGRDKSMVKLRMVGLVTNQAQYISLLYDDLAVPVEILDNPFLGERLQDDMRFVEQIANYIFTFFKELDESIAQQLQSLFFSGVSRCPIYHIYPLPC